MLRRAIALASMLLAGALLAGCEKAAQAGATAPPPASSRGAAVNVDALLREHPLFTVLRQYDREIATLRATESAAPMQRTNVGRDFDEATARVRALSGQRGAMLRRREENAADALLAGDRSADYGAQGTAVRRDAASDMTAYRVALLRQERAALATYARALDSRVRDALAARAQEFDENESTLALQLTKRDAQTRLRLRMRLQYLYNDKRQSAELKSRLAALNASETRVLEARRRSDMASLAGIRGDLQAQAASDYARMTRQMQTKTAANLAARRAVLQAQAGTARTMPAIGASSLAAKLDALRRSDAGLAATISALQNARTDLASRFTALNDTDAASRRDAAAQAGALVRERQMVRAEMVAQIMRYARAAARERGLGTVHAAPGAPAGSVDVTTEVRRDLASLPR